MRAESGASVPAVPALACDVTLLELAILIAAARCSTPVATGDLLRGAGLWLNVDLAGMKLLPTLRRMHQQGWLIADRGRVRATAAGTLAARALLALPRFAQGELVHACEG